MHTEATVPTWAGEYDEWMSVAASLASRLAGHVSDGGRPWVPTIRASSNGEVVDEMEAVSRSFLLAAVHACAAGSVSPLDGPLGQLVRRIVDACNPHSPTPWPRTLSGRSNTVVESASISLGLWLTRDFIWARLDAAQRRHVVGWLRPAVDVPTAANNWVLFPVVTSCFLDAVGEGDGRSYHRIELALARINTWRTDSGWYSDGAGRTFDYYNSWALHFYPVLLSWLIPESAILRDQRAVLQAFLLNFRAFFADDGAHVYFGRSLVYRFAASAAFSVAALTDCAPEPAALCRQYASKNVGYFLRGGATLTEPPMSLGWFGANPPLAQPYSGQMGGLWAAKTFVNLLIPRDAAYWQSLPPSTPPAATLAIPGPNLLVSRSSSGAIVQLTNHGIQNYDARSRHGPVDDKLYSRTSYSTATAPVDDPQGRDSGAYFRTRYGRSGRRSVVAVGIGDNWAASRRVHGTPNPFHIPGRIGYQARRLVPAGPALDVGLVSDELSVAHGSWLVHFYRLTARRPRWVTGVEISGWGVSDATDAFVVTREGRPGALIQHPGVVSEFVVLHGSAQIDIVDVTSSSPFGERTAFPRLTAAFEHGQVHCVATFLGTPEEHAGRPDAPHLTPVDDGFDLEWPDGIRTHVRTDLTGLR